MENEAIEIVKPTTPKAMKVLNGVGDVLVLAQAAYVVKKVVSFGIQALKTRTV